MNFLGSIGFLTPGLLLALLVLPVLWWLLRAVPPAPLKRRFPAVTLLLGLDDRETTPDRTPWWLLLLRILAIGAAIIGFAQPILNPTDRVVGKGPLLIAMDASWASAQSWSARQDKLVELLRLAEQDNRPVAVVHLTDRPKSDEPLAFASASAWVERVDGMEPNGWEPDYSAWRKQVSSQAEMGFETVWFSDGLSRNERGTFRKTLADIGAVSVVEADVAVLALRPIGIADGKIATTALRSQAGEERGIVVTAIGPDPAGITRVLSRSESLFEADHLTVEVVMDPPSELRNRVRTVSLDGIRSAGAVVVTDDSIQRRKVALISGTREQEGAVLVSPLHFLRKALVTTAEVIEADLTDSMLASPDVVVLADVGKLTEPETKALTDWIEEGGTLLRFAGPRLAASEIGQREEHPLLPVRLRAGGRSVGGTMSWGSPKKLAEFSQDSPFFGLSLPQDVEIRSQVVAQPDPTLSERVLANLQDGTPLVTGRELGAGRVVLFHVTANTDWSNLPLSGLFVQMLERLAISTRKSGAGADELEGIVWVPELVMDGFGRLSSSRVLAGVEGSRLASGTPGPDMPPGVYAAGERRIAVNAVGVDRELTPAIWQAGTNFLSLQRSEEKPLKPWFLLLAVVMLGVDILATLWIGGRLVRRLGMVSAVMAVMVFHSGEPAYAQDQSALLQAANNTVLAYVQTGDAKVDRISHAGLLGLSTELFRRTSVEPIEPVGVDLERDALVLFPFLYWPISVSAALPSEEAVARLNLYLRNGGLILFDTRDANLNVGIGGGTPNGRRLQKIAAQLDIPVLEPIPPDHVLTRSFYLLQDFPGRYANAAVWVEAAPPDAELVEGMPFRNLNDGVTPVVIGGNDWASAWAISDRGQFLFPVGRGSAGERQREVALRFGVNLIMHVLTGNYKSDQVHVPALLDRLGQ
ncbi:MAG: DUF4159 domain-containing protein [Rhodobacteraceae bacterium]|nr:DUF4159 domain-containing protein [Paracoccaceae bacterium]